MIKMHSCYVKDCHDGWELEDAVTQYSVMILITRGIVTYRVNGETVTLQKGDALYIPAGSIRGGISQGDHQRFATHFAMNDSDRSLLPILGDQQFCQAAISGFEYFKQRFLLLKHHWLMKGPYSETTCYAILLEMLGIINYDRDKWKLPAIKIDMAEEIKKYILEHYKEPITLNDLSNHIGRTPNYISYLFKTVTGFSPIDYLHHVRISKAKELMFAKTMPISEVADETGFCDQAYFNRVFKKLTGCSPTAFLNGTKG